MTDSDETESDKTEGKKKIGLDVVKKLQPGKSVWDTDVTGFGVRRQRSAARTYILKARESGEPRWFTIGRHGSPWTPKQARTEAKRILGQIADGKNPAAIRDARKDNPTVAELAVAFLEEHVEAKRKPRTHASYKDIIDRLVEPRLGNVRVEDVTRSNVAKLHHSMKATPYQANRALAVLAKMFSWAEVHGYRADGTNPCRLIEKYPERARERFLSEAELARLGEVLADAEREGENPYVVAAVRLLIFTGARLGEILGLEWAHVDIERAMLTLPDSKTGQKPVYLSAPALQTLADIPRQEGNPFVICGNVPGASLVNMQKPWRRIRARAGLDDVRLHDLRHSFASVGASGGLSLPMIGKLLGHTQAQTTARYAHLAADPVRAANEAIGERIAAMMKGEGGGEVIELPKSHG